MTEKLYYIVKATSSPCFGGDGGGTERVEINITNKKVAEKRLTILKKNNIYNHIICWIDFDWKE